MKRLSAWFNLGLLVLMAVLVVVRYVLTGTTDFPKEDPSPLVSGFLTIYGIVVLCFFINDLRLLYMAWKAIQDGRASVSPGKAVGYLFIPIWNLFWMFYSYVWYAKDYNRYLKRYDIKIPRLPVWVFMTHAISYLGTAVFFCFGMYAMHTDLLWLVEPLGEVSNAFVGSTIAVIYVYLYVSYNRLVSTERHQEFMASLKLKKENPVEFARRLREQKGED